MYYLWEFVCELLEIPVSCASLCILIYEDHCFESRYYLWEFVCELLKILVSCAYFEILLMVCEMTDPLLGAPCDAPKPGGPLTTRQATEYK